MTSGTPKRIIRIFISSTFRDFQKERDALAQDVFCDLRKYCESRGFSFHPIDLRWGVPAEDSVNNTALSICLDEIRRSKALSPHINFMILAGDNYGWQPLPETIENIVWKKLTQHLNPDCLLRRYLEIYYRQDTNSLNLHYCLMPRSYIDSFHINRDTADDMIRAGLNRLLDMSKNDSIGIPAWDKLWKHLKWQFNASATEQEIAEGYFNEQNPEARYNTFILLKTGVPHGSGGASDVFSAESLRSRLRTFVSEEHSVQICEKNAENDNYWIAAARHFLRRAIDEQIAQYAGMNYAGWEQEILAESCRYVNENYIPLPAANDLTHFLEAGIGHQILLTGNSGSGKSWFLRHFFSSEGNGTAAAIFNDVEPRGRSFLSALEMIIRGLRGTGRLSGEMTLPDPDDPAGWFEKELRKLKQDKPVIIILDSINGQNMPDYKSSPGKSIFQISLPPCVTLIISAVSENDLREIDYSFINLKYNLPALHPQEGIRRLYMILECHGRRLTESGLHPQCSMAERCIEQSPELCSALAIEILAQLAMTLQCWDDFPFSGKIDFHTLIRYALLKQNRDDYRLLRSHALGYMALSSIGLTEPEIIDLLSADTEVTDEIRAQTAKQGAAWEFTGTIPTVLWALLYTDIKPFLTEINDEGMNLLQLRHTRLREEIFCILGDTLSKKLLEKLLAYFSNQEWLLCSEDSVRANRRKVQECLPACEKLHDVDKLSAFLSDPLCVDAFVRCSLRTEIKQYLMKYGSHPLSGQMLSAVRQKELLFRLWPDSFIPSSAAQLCFENNGFVCADSLHDLLHRTSNRYCIKRDFYSDDGAFFPELYRNCHFALDTKDHAAVLMDGVLRIIDLEKQEFLGVRYPTVQDEAFIYWDRDVLTVRCQRRRLCYRFRNSQLTFLYDEKAPDWGDLISRKTEKILSAGGWREAEAFGFGITGLPGMLEYHQDNKIISHSIYEPYNFSTRFTIHDTLAAIVLDGKRLIIAELTNDTKLYDKILNGITEVDWSETGHELLVVQYGNTLHRITVDPQKVIGYLAVPKNASEGYRNLVDVGRLAADMGQTMQKVAVTHYDAYTVPGEPSGSFPLFGAISLKYGWAACYFYADTGAFIRVLDLVSKKTDIIKDVSEITYNDCQKNPFYASQDGRELVLISRGKTIFFDMKEHISGRVPGDVRKNPLDQTSESIRSAYAAFMADNLHLDTSVWPENAKKISHSPLLLHRRKKSNEIIGKIRTIIPFYHLLASEVLKIGNIYWLVDKDNGMIHACDESGNCLARDMLPTRILAADIDSTGGCLYLFVGKRDLIRISLEER